MQPLGRSVRYALLCFYTKSHLLAEATVNTKARTLCMHILYQPCFQRMDVIMMQHSTLLYHLLHESKWSLLRLEEKNVTPHSFTQIFRYQFAHHGCCVPSGKRKVLKETERLKTTEGSH